QRPLVRSRTVVFLQRSGQALAHSVAKQHFSQAALLPETISTAHELLCEIVGRQPGEVSLPRRLVPQLGLVWGIPQTIADRTDRLMVHPNEACELTIRRVWPLAEQTGDRRTLLRTRQRLRRPSRGLQSAFVCKVRRRAPGRRL